MKRILILFLAVLYSLTLYNALNAQYLINENTLAITEVKPINLHFCNKIDSIISNTIINYETPVNNLRGEWTLDSTGATDKPCGEGVRMLTQNCC